MNFGRIKAIIFKSLLHMFVSIEEIVDTFVWPILDLVIWGIMTSYLLKMGPGSMMIVRFLLGGLLLWNIVWRTQQDISVGTLRNVWSGVFISLFASPLTPSEYMGALMILALGKIVVVMGLIGGLAYFLYSFNIFTMGIFLAPMFGLLLLFGWAMGFMITGLIIRYGLRIQSLAWSLVGILSPLCCIFYPLKTLPSFFQKIAQVFPATYVFEGMREVLEKGSYPAGYFIKGAILDLAWVILGILIFYYFFEKAREAGRLIRIEE